MMRRILLATDGSRNALGAVHYVANLYKGASDVEVMVLNLISGSLLSSFIAPISTPKWTDLRWVSRSSLVFHSSLKKMMFSASTST